MAPLASSDPEVKTCSKTCLKNYKSLKKQYEDMVAKKHETEFKAITYKRGLDTVEAQLVTYRKNEKNSDAPLIEEWVSDNEDEVESPIVVEKKTVVPYILKVMLCRPKQTMKNQLGKQLIFDHLQYTCKQKRQLNGQRKEKPVWKNTRRVNDHYFTRMTHSNPRRTMIPQAVLMMSEIKAVNISKPKDAHNAVKRNRFNIVTASACWVWDANEQVVDNIDAHAQGRQECSKEKEESREECSKSRKTKKMKCFSIQRIPVYGYGDLTGKEIDEVGEVHHLETYGNMQGISNIFSRMHILHTLTIQRLKAYNPSPEVEQTEIRREDNEVTVTKVIKEEFDKLESPKISDDSFTCNTSLEIFHKEFNRMSRMDDDLFTYRVEIPGLANIPCDLKEGDDSE
ncbi:hypothetical protein Tco_0716873 [Tanacetum coccineum]